MLWIAVAFVVGLVLGAIAMAVGGAIWFWRYYDLGYDRKAKSDSSDPR